MLQTQKRRPARGGESELHIAGVINGSENTEAVPSTQETTALAAAFARALERRVVHARGTR